jgi:hypothetical protein
MATPINEADVPNIVLALTALESMRGATLATDITAEEHAMILAARRSTHTKFLENKGITVRPTPRDAPAAAVAADAQDTVPTD